MGVVEDGPDLLLGDPLRLPVRLGDGLLGLAFRFREQGRCFDLGLPARADLQVGGFALGLGEQAVDDGHGRPAGALGLAQQRFVAPHEVFEGVGNVLGLGLGLGAGVGGGWGRRRLRGTGRGLLRMGLRRRRLLLATP